ncbi:hypothetical protein ymoll0001_33670 [Yersinia mollaretii ATCC 43969]|uniref:PheST operon leader peptide PheM n=1 Tax=Yersinia mollaretii (strain ATCC 43969 / DSM 18520 / CIP 103324 / CNY 7263 / WAIP 204) TaxID=349967 RepID=A0ABP2EEV6_YERMW|nr:hypothetical protein ymoll0001_33670 [Yersinia mollaretii ATCC 43969]
MLRDYGHYAFFTVICLFCTNFSALKQKTRARQPQVKAYFNLFSPICPKAS